MTAFPFNTTLIDGKTRNRFVVKTRSDVGGGRSLFLSDDSTTIKRNQIVCEYARQLTFIELDEYNHIAKAEQISCSYAVLYTKNTVAIPTNLDMEVDDDDADDQSVVYNWGY